MATRIKGLTPIDYKRTPRSFYRRYLDGRAWSLGPEDAERPPGKVEAMRASVRAAAKAFGIAVRTQAVNGKLEVQALRETLEPYRHPKNVPPRINIPKEESETT
jgi:hypothetical protein